MGRSDRRCQRGSVFSILLHDDSDANLRKSIKIQPSVIGYIAKSIALVGKGDKDAGYRACDIAFEYFRTTHVSFLLLIKVFISCIGTRLSLRCSFCLGCHRVYGRRAQRCVISHGRPHRYGGRELNMLRGSGTCIMRYHTANMTTDISSRHICIFSLETFLWRAATTSVRYNRSSVHKPKRGATRVNHSWWSHW